MKKETEYFSKKGSIIVALLFVIVLTITAASFFIMIGGRTAFTVNQLKRAQAINYAEAALYEAFNRFRSGDWNPALSLTDEEIVIDEVAVKINYPNPLTSAGGGDGKISATVDCDNIEL